MLATQARLEPGQNNILILWQVLWDQTTRDEYPRFVLHWEETIVMTPAAPWESHSATAHRKEKAGRRKLAFSTSRTSPFPSHVLHPILPHSWHARIKKQHRKVVWAVPVPTRELVHGCLVPSERGGLASVLQCHCCHMALPAKLLPDWAAWHGPSTAEQTPQCGKFLKKQLPLNHIFI